MTTAKTRQRLVIGNWKMNGSLVANEVLLKGIREGVENTGEGVENTGAPVNCTIAVCPSFPYLVQVSQALAGSPVSWGAQDVSLQESGAFTGEVSAAMLNDFNCAWALVGHSERRALHGETSEQVALKAQAALAHHITPVVCVGETLQDREQGNTLAVIQAQLAPVLALGEQAVNKMVIAYEPVWLFRSQKPSSNAGSSPVRPLAARQKRGFRSPKNLVPKSFRSTPWRFIAAWTSEPPNPLWRNGNRSPTICLTWPIRARTSVLPPTSLTPKPPSGIFSLETVSPSLLEARVSIFAPCCADYSTAPVPIP